MDNHKQGSIQLFCSLTQKDFEIVTWAKITWQMDYHNQGSIQLFCSLTQKRFWDSNMSKDYMTNGLS